MPRNPFSGAVWLVLVGIACWAGITYWFVKDYGELSDDEQKLVGTWSLKDIAGTGFRAAKCEFREDGTFRFTVVDVLKKEREISKGKWSISGKTVIMHHHAEEEETRIETLTLVSIEANRLVVSPKEGTKVTYTRAPATTEKPRP